MPIAFARDSDIMRFTHELERGLEAEMDEKRSNWKAALRYGAIEALYWSICATYGGFMVTFALDRGYPQSMVSIMCAGYMISVFAGQFFWGSLCDKIRSNKKIFIFAVLVAETVQIGMFVFKPMAVFGILYAMFGFFMGPMATISDTWLLKSVHYDMKVYGVARGAGSAFYAVATLAMGYLIESLGFVIMPVVSSVCVAATILLAIASEDAKFEEGSKNSGGISTKDILSILKVPAYVVLLIVVFLIGMANSPINSLKIVLIEDVGGGVSTLGWDTFWGCALQFLLFELAGFFAVIPAKYRLLITAVAMFVTTLVYYAAAAPWMIIAGTVVGNIHYGFLMPALREMILHTVDAKYQTTANGLADAFYGSMSGALSLLYAGAIAETYGAKQMVMVSVCIAIVPVVILLIQNQVTRRKISK